MVLILGSGEMAGDFQVVYSVGDPHLDQTVSSESRTLGRFLHRHSAGNVQALVMDVNVS